MSLRELYQEMIVDHGKNPRNFGKLANASHSKIGYNPLCGDQLILFIEINSGIVEEILFEGKGCAISMASASLMTEAVKGKSVAEAEKLFANFHELVTQRKEAENLGKLAIFGGVAEFPIRVKCATLAWHTLKAALHNDNEQVTTE